MRPAPAGAELRALLDFVPDAVLTLSPEGVVDYANRAALEICGDGIVGADLAERQPDRERATFGDFLRRCASSTGATAGSLTLPDRHGVLHRYRAFGRRLSGGPDADTVRLALRLRDARRDRFAAVSRHVRRLNRQMRITRLARRDLEAAVEERTLLLRELHHRVKNNLQVLMSMFSAAERKATGEELTEFLKSAKGRLLAMSAVHDAMHRSDCPETASTADLLPRLAEAVGAALRPAATIRTEIEDLRVPNELTLPLALVLNELLGNALRHGTKEGEEGTVTIAFREREREYELVVADDGPGLPEAVQIDRRSGLGMVEGLAGRLGGSLSIGSGDGTRCTVRLPQQRT